MGGKMHFSPNFKLLVVFWATVLQTARSGPCQPCDPGDCLPFLEYCCSDTFNQPENIVTPGDRNYATALKPPTGPTQTYPTYERYRPRFQLFSRDQSCLVDYLFGLKRQNFPNPGHSVCRLRQPFVLAWVALAAMLMVMVLCCLCQCCCGCGAARSTPRRSGHGRGDVLMLRA